MNKQDQLLADLAEDEDAVLVQIVAEPEPHRLRALVRKIYSARHGIKRSQLGHDIEFIHAPDTWGNTALKVGDVAIVFLSDLSGALYEASWRGHMLVEDIDGEPHVIFPQLVQGTDHTDPYSYSRPDPKRPNTRAISLSRIDSHLAALYT